MPTRRLAAIIAADVVAFSARMETDEEGTAALVQDLFREHVRPRAGRYSGRIVKTTGDGFLAEFGSPLDAVNFAVSLQEAIAGAALKLRVGVNLGDVIIQEDGDILGEGVNIAARLEGLCDPGGVFISEKVFQEVIGKVPQHFTSRGEQLLKNIRRPVHIYSWGGDASTSERAPLPVPLTLPDQPSIAVLPFSYGGDADQEAFADGVVDELITALSRVRAFFVISRTSTFTYKNKPTDVRRVGAELGVRYVLEGSIRRAGSTLRISGQLVDASTGRHLWADRFQGGLEDIFALQDQVTESVTAALEPSVRLAEMARVRAKPTQNVGAYELYLRALTPMYRMTTEGIELAMELAHRSLQLDPGFALSKAVGSFCRGVRFSYTADVEDAARASSMAREAVALAPDDPTVLRMAAHTLAYCVRDYDASLDAVDRSLRLNANSSQAYSASGWVRLYIGEVHLAEEHFKRALRLSPIDPERGIALCGLGVAAHMLGNVENALRIARQADRETNFPSARKGLIHALVARGHLEEARSTAKSLLASYPGFTMEHQARLTPWKDQRFARDYEEALRIAGIPQK